MTGGESRPGDPRTLVEVEAVAEAEPRPCPPRRTGYPVGASLEVTAGAPLAPKDLDFLIRQQSLHPEINLIAAAAAVTGGESRPSDPRTLVEVEGVAEGELRPCPRGPVEA